MVEGKHAVIDGSSSVLHPLASSPARLTETFDWSTSRFPLLIEALGFPRRNLAGISKTLVRLEKVAVEAAAAAPGEI